MKKKKSARKKKTNPGELVVLGLSGNPRRGRASKKKAGKRPRASKGKGKKNSTALEHAKDLFKKFHGKSPKKVLELHRETETRQDYTALGDLVAIGIDADSFDKAKMSPDDVVTNWDKLPHLKFPKGEGILASSPDGRQLYVLGESQDLDLEAIDIDTDTSKDLVELGPATYIVYSARKAPSFQDVDWVHTFGEEGGDRPLLVYDKLSKILLFVGGSYRVEQPGIID